MKIVYKRTDGGFEFMEQLDDRRVNTIATLNLKDGDTWLIDEDTPAKLALMIEIALIEAIKEDRTMTDFGKFFKNDEPGLEAGRTFPGEI